MNLDWYESFFQGIALELWRKAVSPEQTRAEADFLERALSLRRGARVLDVPCGGGRHATALAARGLRVTGIDLSSEAIAEARERAAAAQLSIEWIEADMRELPWQSEFDGAFCFGNSFGYLPPSGTRAFVQAVARALKPGGRFALDSGMSAESLLPNLQHQESRQIEDILFCEENLYHVLDGCLETRYTFIRGGETQTRTGLHWVHTVREIRSFLRDAGLVPTAAYGSLEGESFELGRPYLILVAHKE